jgi:hypothetical protein
MRCAFLPEIQGSHSGKNVGRSCVLRQGLLAVDVTNTFSPMCLQM